jgi:hypothetical protein
LAFKKIVHVVKTADTISYGTLISVLCSGELKLDNGENPLRFSHMFVLAPQANRFYVQNEIFRLNLD